MDYRYWFTCAPSTEGFIEEGRQMKNSHVSFPRKFLWRFWVVDRFNVDVDLISVTYVAISVYGQSTKVQIYIKTDWCIFRQSNIIFYNHLNCLLAAFVCLVLKQFSWMLSSMTSLCTRDVVGKELVKEMWIF